MRKEALIAIGFGLAAIEASKFGFTHKARKEVGRRDRWECQSGEKCLTAPLNNGRPARHQDGFFVQAAHYPKDHHKTGKGFHDPDISNGRILCSCCHALEELHRDNEWGAKKLLSKGGIFTIDRAEEQGYQLNPTIEELIEIANRLDQYQDSQDAEEKIDHPQPVSFFGHRSPFAHHS